MQAFTVKTRTVIKKPLWLIVTLHSFFLFHFSFFCFFLIFLIFFICLLFRCPTIHSLVNQGSSHFHSFFTSFIHCSSIIHQLFKLLFLSQSTHSSTNHLSFFPLSIFQPMLPSLLYLSINLFISQLLLTIHYVLIQCPLVKHSLNFAIFHL